MENLEHQIKKEVLRMIDELEFKDPKTKETLRSDCLMMTNKYLKTLYNLMYSQYKKHQ